MKRGKSEDFVSCGIAIAGFFAMIEIMHVIYKCHRETASAALSVKSKHFKN